MSEKVTVELPDELAQRARTAAAHSQRRLEDALVDWIDRAIAEPAIELLSDDQVLALCDSQMDARQHEELSDLLTRNREAMLQKPDSGRLDELMRVYRRGLIRKAQALKTAVVRGLRPRVT